uniref:Uncharacterized protein n=1 Tax=Arundo donax TaxID=35708 RepID=A0A0A9BQ75_ARUDO
MYVELGCRDCMEPSCITYPSGLSLFTWCQFKFIN